MRIIRCFYALLAGVLLIAVPSLLLASTARTDDGDSAVTATGATITVTTTDDELNSDGDCSLREAIQAANTDAAVDACPAGVMSDTIVIPAGVYTLTVAGADEDGNATGDLDIVESVTILGAGAVSTTIDGNNLDRIFHFLGTTAKLADVSIVNGLVNLVESGGGGIFNVNSTLLVRDSIVANNVANNCGGLFNAASENRTSSLTIQNVQVLDNTATGASSTLGWGGGICNASLDSGTAVLTVTESIVATNSSSGPLAVSGAGGGIVNGAVQCSECSALATIERSAIRDNTAFFGGGVGNTVWQPAFGTPTVQLTLDRTTVSGNSAIGTGMNRGAGGGIAAGSGVTTISNSTISGNVANGTGSNFEGTGGGLVVVSNFGLTARSIISNTTIAENNAVAAGGGLYVGQISSITPTVTIANSIVGANGAPAGASCSDGLSSITSAGYNLEDGNSCGFDQNTDIILTDPGLGPLQDNGGPTETHAALPPSPAVDQGHCPGAGADQRGVPRPFDVPYVANADDGCDIGAYEFELPPLNRYLPIVRKP